MRNWERLGTAARIAGIMTALLLAALIGTLVLRGFDASAERDGALNAERHTFVVLIEAERLDNAIHAAEGAARGYLLIGEPKFRAAAERQIAGARASASRLTALTADNPRQVANLRALGPDLDGRINRLRQLMAARAANTYTHNPLEPGYQLSLRISTVLDRIRSEEQRLLEMRRRSASAARDRADETRFLLSLLTIALACAAIAGAIAGWEGRRRTRSALEREARDAELRTLLEVRVAERTAELRESNLRLERAAEETARAEAQIRQMQKTEAIGQLTGGIAHDFNNMLAIVLGSLDLARRRLPSDPAKAQSYIEAAEEGARRAAQLTQRLLAFARQQPLTPEPTDINKLVSDTSEMIRRTIGDHLRLETVLAGGLWRANIDRTQLETALLNLAVNARDALPDGGGRITLETANTFLDEHYADAHNEVRPGQYVVVAVTDTGTGMPPEIVNRAFDPFFTTKPTGKGTGLGLSQVFGFVKQSGGHIKIYSEVGVGTTVKLYLPRWFGEPKPESDPGPALGELPRARKAETILVVEDEAQVRAMSTDTLSELGYTVIQAPDGAGALAILGGPSPVDLLFTDVVMPEMNGRELADRALALRPNLKLLFTTGYSRNAVVHNGVVDPSASLLSKPFSMRELAVRVRVLLDGDA